ncbi:hypothetical protein JKF63_01123 [Porcisia hertigi]|uniref:Uncharacterized protein n=1 Tax=Porcisia hertigi TaxID=2761500 RepID=A0A836L317_9TRYP|nr:hypothetical protein JKF63_01123 [Porcisia hertigi]
MPVLTNANALPNVPSPQQLQLDISTTALALDRKVVQGLFMALRTSIPQDVQRSLLFNCREELQFLIARQPRLSAFHHRRRESLRHPALAMATRKYYRECRRRRLEMMLQEIAPTEDHPLSLSTNPLAAQVRTGSSAVQREAMLVDLLYSAYTQQSTGYRKGQDSQGDYYTTNAGSGDLCTSRSSLAFSTQPTSIGLHQLGTFYGEQESEMGLHKLTSPFGGYAADSRSPMASGSSSILPRRPPPLKQLRNTNEESISCFSDALSGGSFSRISFANLPGEGAESGIGPRTRGVNAGPPVISAPGGAGFFARRIGYKHNAASGRKGDSGCSFGGTMLPGWTAEMMRLLQRRADEERDAGTGNDPYLFISARPVEHLLCSYGSVLRDPATLVRSAASMVLEYDNAKMTDADPLSDAIVDEEARWDQLAGCHCQLLRAACGPCRAAASVVASDGLVNDVIRRFWDRLTVSVAAQSAHKTQEAHKSRAAAEAEMEAAAVAQKSRHGGQADEDDLNEIVDNGNKEGDDTLDEKAGGGGGGGGGSRTGHTGAAASGSRSSPQQGAKRRSRTSKASKKPKKKNTRDADSSEASASAGGKSDHCSSVAYYMSPLQYVYLHTRMAHVLLPDCEAVEVELLPYIQEDLLVDAAYNERDPAQTFYFGEAPRLVGDTGRHCRNSITSLNVGFSSKTSNTDKRKESGSYDAAGDDLMYADGDRAGKASLSLQRRFLAVRRNGYAHNRPSQGDLRWRSGMSDMSLWDAGTTIGPTSSMAVALEDRSSTHGSISPARGIGNPSVSGSLVPTSFTVEQLPWLTYSQFWCSMMELADNWTCCGGNPVETAVFLWELYTEAFGHSWGEEDKSLAAAVEKRAAKLTLSEAEKAELAKAEQDAMESFEALLVEIQERGSQLPSVRSSFDSISDIAYSETDGAHHRRRKSKKKRGLGINSSSTPSTDTDDDELLSLTSECSEVPLSEWKRLVKAKGKGGDKWVYVERVGDDGVTRRYRRRMLHSGHSSRSHGVSQQGAHRTSYIIEEELDESGAVLKRRKVRCDIVLSSDGSEFDDDGALYAADERAPEFLRRKYFEDKPKKFRRLEIRHRVTAGYDRSDSPSSSITSWSSIDDDRDYDSDDGDSDDGGDITDGMSDGFRDDRRLGRRRRRRRRHTGLRRDRLRFSKEDDRYRRWKSEVQDLGRFSLSDDKTDDDSPESNEPKSDKAPLTHKELKHLLDRKEWLSSVLKEKGIILPSQFSDDPNQERILYNLLRLAEKSEESGEDFFHLADGEGGDGSGLSALATLLAQLQTLSLDELANTSLMRRLLGEGEEGGAGTRQLTQEQMRDVLMALLKEQQKVGDHKNTGRAEPESVRDRRLRLLRMLEERRALQSGKKGSVDDLPTEETFGLTEVFSPPFRPPSPKGLGESSVPTSLPMYMPLSRPQSARPPISASMNTSSPGFSVHALQVPRNNEVSSGNSSAASTVRLTTNSILWKISPTTLAERKEMERLFRELEAYWADRTSYSGRFRVDIVDYTPEQLEEFFAHLHLGPRQRALLRGRAPLAAGTSLVGGTMHQGDFPMASENGVTTAGARQEHGHAASGKPASSLVPSPPLLTPAPVKLFTLTTKDSLDKALSSSYQSYLQDKAFTEALHGNIKLETAGPVRVPTTTRFPKAPPLPSLRLGESLKKAVSDRARGVLGISGAPNSLQPQKSSPPPSLPKL